ncbi:hypothetical protein C5167_024912 [Papaver somniferum]|uniref:F-box associated beta-propeller type 3 domain-containing protein n=2 Tax=Papaver somniferum TaxID=3469 RepID=A0A4Y7JSV9_PAPSO|nr:hypothetical protein C5167_024912 [Papaver somniferum]
MRFKCVCKSWLSLIEDDSYFIYLHLIRSRLRPCFTLAIPRELVKWCSPGECDHIRLQKADIVIADLSETGRMIAGEPPMLVNVRQTVLLNYDEVSKPVNGLVCFTSTTRPYFGVRIYNLSTRELSPWIRTTFPKKKKRHVNYLPTYHFGFDPATKEHKVICIWDYKQNDSAWYHGCLVMTVGANTWRTIDGVPQHYLERPAVYANGSVHWIAYDLFHGHIRKLLIVAFHVGSEKFTTIVVPKFITDQFGKDFHPVTHLLEVNDHVALSHVLPRGNITKIWIPDDTTNWREVTLELPFQWNENRWVEFHGIAGTDQLFLETYNDRTDMKHLSLYSYNWKSKAFTKVETGVLYSSIPNLTALPEYEKKDEFLCETFIESLLRVPNK